MNHQEGPIYPNNMWRPQEPVVQRTTKKTGARPMITTAMMKAISREEAKKPNAPRFKCPGCQSIYRLQDARFCKDTDHPFIAPTNVCAWCAHKKQTRWQRI